MLFSRHSLALAASLTMAAAMGQTPVVMGRLTINNSSGSTYSVGQTWNLDLTGAPEDTSFRFCIAYNFHRSCTDNFGKTNAQGNWSLSGAFTQDVAGEWQEWIEYPSGATSNVISFSVGQNYPGSFKINGANGGTFLTENFLLTFAGNRSSAVFDLCINFPGGAVSCARNFGATNPSGMWSYAGKFDGKTTGVFTEWLRFPDGSESNRITFTLGFEIQYRLWGINLGPFLSREEDPTFGATVSEQRLEELIRKIAPYTRWVRTYGSTHGLEHVGRIARKYGLKVALGIWLNRDSIANDREIQSALAVFRKGEADVILVGSETLLRGDLSEAQLAAYLRQVKAAAPNAIVTTSEPPQQLLNNPAVAAACDVLFVNIYPYWQGIPIDKAAASLNADYEKLRARYPQKEVIVGETGWPSGGNSVGAAVPTPANAARYFLNSVSWARARGVKMFYFEGFNEAWKFAYEGPQGNFWGIWDGQLNLKPGMEDVFLGKTVPDNWSNPGLLLPGGPGTPTVSLTSIPPRGSFNDLRGQVLHVSPAEHYVGVYIRVDGRWWTKPTWASPRTSINFDGTFTVDITTGGIDQFADAIDVYVLPNSYNIPLAYGEYFLAAALQSTAVAQVRVNR